MSQANQDDAQHVWDLAKKIGIAMLGSWDGRAPRTRPMSAHVDGDDNAIYFLADKNNHKTDDLTKYPSVVLAFADVGDNKYVSISGEAAVIDDRAKIKELWTSWAKAWWQSPDDPNIRVIKVTPAEAEFWDTPGKIVSYTKMAVAAATGSRPNIGENKKVAM